VEWWSGVVELLIRRDGGEEGEGSLQDGPYLSCYACDKTVKQSEAKL